MKKTLKVMAAIPGILVVAFIIYAIYVFTSYYRIPDKVTLEVKRSGENAYFEEEAVIRKNTVYKIMTYNIGFGAYTPEFSFFMDGGKSSWAKDKESVLATVSNAGEMISEKNPDFILLQEVDVNGTRSYHVDQLALLNQFIKGYYYDYAQNYDSPFLMFPPWQPHGANEAGIVTYSRAEITDTMRRSLPISESFSKLVDLDRCYSISRIPLEEGGSLCIYNMHMSAYGSSDEIREGQISMLVEDMKMDYENGNYVICGGDFNHDLKADAGSVPEVSWAFPFPRESLPKGFSMAIDWADEEEVLHNSCRTANEPYDEETAFTVTLDGFIISNNVKVVTYRNLDNGYRFSDHDPVLMEFILA